MTTTADPDQLTCDRCDEPSCHTLRFAVLEQTYSLRLCWRHAAERAFGPPPRRLAETAGGPR